MLLMLANTCCAQYISIQDKQNFCMDFLKNVVGVQMSAYPYPLVSVTGYGPAPTVKIRLSGSSSQHETVFFFTDNDLGYYALYAMNGALPLAEAPQNSTLAVASKALEQYRLCFNQAHCSDLGDMLKDLPQQCTRQTVQRGNVVLTVTDGGGETRLDWRYVIDEIQTPRALTMKVSDQGYVTFFSDNWERTPIGATHITVTEEKAIEMAYADANATIQKLGATVERVNATLYFKADTDGTRGNDTKTVYPGWSVELFFDRWYGDICGYVFNVWADTGQALGGHAQGMFRRLPLDKRSTASNGDASNDYSLPLAGISAALVVVGLTVTFRKRISRRRRS